VSQIRVAVVRSRDIVIEKALKVAVCEGVSRVEGSFQQLTVKNSCKRKQPFDLRLRLYIEGMPAKCKVAMSALVRKAEAKQ
jgi:hypothetical protein